MFVNITTVAGKNTTNQKHTATTSLRKYCFFVNCPKGTFVYDILSECLDCSKFLPGRSTLLLVFYVKKVIFCCDLKMIFVVVLCHSS